MEEMTDSQNLPHIQMNNQSFMEEVENKEMKKLLNTPAEGVRPPASQLNLDFFQLDNDVPKEKYSNTKVKSSNLLTNV